MSGGWVGGRWVAHPEQILRPPAAPAARPRAPAAGVVIAIRPVVGRGAAAAASRHGASPRRRHNRVAERRPASPLGGGVGAPGHGADPLDAADGPVRLRPRADTRTRSKEHSRAAHTRL